MQVQTKPKTFEALSLHHLLSHPLKFNVALKNICEQLGFGKVTVKLSNPFKFPNCEIWIQNTAQPFPSDLKQVIYDCVRNKKGANNHITDHLIKLPSAYIWITAIDRIAEPVVIS